MWPRQNTAESELKTPSSIQWSEALSMHNPEIDDEHKHFIQLVNELNRALLDRRSKDDIVRIMILILKDSILHFTHEEQLFAKKHYPKTAEHTKIHSDLITQFEKKLETIEESEFSREWIEIGISIRDALVQHVVHEDTQYIDYLRTDIDYQQPEK